MSSTVAVKLGPRSYDIVVTSEDLVGVGPFARERNKGTMALVVTDHNVQGHAEVVSESLRNAGFSVELVVIGSGEEQKALGVANQLYDRLIECHADRHTLVVAVGGGVIGDLAGFVAATFARGVALLMVPTTLLAMVDSSVGGKVAVNHPRAKNMIGAFHQPRGVWIDTAVLNTLPAREFRSGLAEIVKYGMIMDADFFQFLEANIEAINQRQPDVIRQIIARCCELKAHVVENDEREETGLRAILNYGHTFAHAYESAGGYGAWLHGEAVAAGMASAALLGVRRGLIGKDLLERQNQLLTAFQLPITIPQWPIDDMIATMRRDKKSVGGKLRFILPKRLGEVALFADIPEEDVVAVLQACQA